MTKRNVNDLYREHGVSNSASARERMPIVEKALGVVMTGVHREGSSKKKYEPMLRMLEEIYESGRDPSDFEMEKAREAMEHDAQQRERREQAYRDLCEDIESLR